MPSMCDLLVIQLYMQTPRVVGAASKADYPAALRTHRTTHTHTNQINADATPASAGKLRLRPCSSAAGWLAGAHELIRVHACAQSTTLQRRAARPHSSAAASCDVIGRQYDTLALALVPSNVDIVRAGPRVRQGDCGHQSPSLSTFAFSTMNLPSLYFWLSSNACSYFQPSTVLQPMQ